VVHEGGGGGDGGDAEVAGELGEAVEAGAVLPVVAGGEQEVAGLGEAADEPAGL
jgi:hypothetical protein